MRLTQSFHRPDLKICRCAASWPRKAIWVRITASTAAQASCHQLSPVQMNAATHPASTSTAPTSLLQ